MEAKSLLKFYVGNKSIGSTHPVLVVTGDTTWKNMFFGEHFLFVDFPKLPFVCRRDTISPTESNPDIFDFDRFPEFFSAESLLKSQAISARAHLECSLSTLDMKAYREIFCEGRVFEFVECDDYPLVRFQLYGKHSKEMATMFENARTRKIRELKEKFHRLPKLSIKEEQTNGKA